MTNEARFSLFRKLISLLVLVICLGVFISTNVTPKASANVLCCYCQEEYDICVPACMTGQPNGYGCTSNCEYCCRYEANYIPHCFDICDLEAGQSCETTEQCPLGSHCDGGSGQCVPDCNY